PIWGRKLPKSLEDMTAGLSSVRPPETKWEYNNFAYGTAGLLVQKISGVEYEKYMVDNVLKPLGVTTAHPVYPSPEMGERLAVRLASPRRRFRCTSTSILPATFISPRETWRATSLRNSTAVCSTARGSSRRSRCARCTRRVLVATMGSASGSFTTPQVGTR